MDNNTIERVVTLMKDEGCESAAVEVYTGKWSKRKVNLAVRAIEDGISTAGMKTSWLLRALVGGEGVPIAFIGSGKTSWGAKYLIDRDLIRPDKFDDLIAIRTAQVKMTDQSKRTYWENQFLEVGLDHMRTYFQSAIHLPYSMTPSQAVAFVQPYIKQRSDEELTRAAHLANSIREGKTFTVRIG